MLLITAILFVKIAQHISPDPDPVEQQVEARAFYGWITLLLSFDVLGLILDRIKSSLLGTQGKQELSAYGRWIVLNMAFGAVCCVMWASLPNGPFLFIPGLSLYTASIIVFVAAFLRTILDYSFGKDFLFP